MYSVGIEDKGGRGRERGREGEREGGRKKRGREGGRGEGGRERRGREGGRGEEGRRMCEERLLHHLYLAKTITQYGSTVYIGIAMGCPAL